ncbi:hypothetical protein PCH_Pc18g06120 [Penicillium rubens Wisconsin 54-1255]|uniref:Uncharacterized protein n=1 Tax=Penicillium rubens (strain ATCC 28089 / DSM 1075 / NRRL 1951 / Wisconsin 54-1255) TaxID=500485 RepID=B6HCI9_PENRW|nr:hypothetical protein PCH_Pc18g06120 [Penicillium rubens Wisconsin 54-1255]
MAGGNAHLALFSLIAEVYALARKTLTKKKRERELSLHWTTHLYGVAAIVWGLHGLVIQQAAHWLSALGILAMARDRPWPIWPWFGCAITALLLSAGALAPAGAFVAEGVQATVCPTGRSVQDMALCLDSRRLDDLAEAASSLSGYRQCIPVPVADIGSRHLSSAFVSFDTFFRGADNAACIRIEAHLVDNPKGNTAPYPDVSVSLRRSQFMGYEPTLHHLDHIASPISRTPDLIFPCFALEAKGDSGGMDAEIRNRHNTANMLFNLRLWPVPECWAEQAERAEANYPGLFALLDHDWAHSQHFSWSICLTVIDQSLTTLYLLFTIAKAVSE